MNYLPAFNALRAMCLLGRTCCFFFTGLAWSAHPVFAQSPGELVAHEQQIYISDIRLEGNTLFPEAELLSDTVNTTEESQTFQSLQYIAQQVEDYYHERNYRLVKVIIPQQDIIEQKGVLRIQVIEGNLGQIHISGNKRFATKHIEGYFKRLEPGAPLEINYLEDILHQINTLSGIELGAALEPGAAQGETDLGITVEEQPRVMGGIEVNNFGTDTTGKYRVLPKVTFPNLLGRGDSLGLGLVASVDIDETLYGQASYTTPIGYEGLSFSSYVSGGNYEVGEEFSLLGIEGESISWGTGLSYPLIFKARETLIIDGWFVYRDSEQMLLGTTTSEDKIRKLQLGISYDRKDDRGRTFITTRLHQGLGEWLAGMDNNSLLSSRAFAEADNSFTKFTLDLTRLQRINDRAYIYARASGQYTFDTLVASEQWAIGGADSVRGHPQSSFLGDHGYTINIEGRYSILPEKQDIQIAAFFDHGQILVEKPVVNQRKRESINGAGVGLRLSFIEHISLRADVATPLGNTTDDNLYFYLQANFSF